MDPHRESLRESPPAGSPPPNPNSQDEHGDVAEVGVPSRKTEEVEHLLAKLKNAGMEIDEEMARIIDEGVAGIKAKAMSESCIDREAMDKARRSESIRRRRLIVPATTAVFGLSLFTIACASSFAGICLGVKHYDEYLKKDLGNYLHLARAIKYSVEGPGLLKLIASASKQR